MGEHSWPWAAGLAHKNAALSAPYCPPRLEPQVAGGQPKATGGEPGLSRSRVRWVRYLLSLHTTRTHATKNNHVLEGRFKYKLLLSLINRRWPERESNPRHADFQSAALPTELPGLRGGNIERGRWRAKGPPENRLARGGVSRAPASGAREAAPCPALLPLAGCSVTSARVARL